MKVCTYQVLIDGELKVEVFPEQLRCVLTKLPDQPALYFVGATDAVLIPVQNLILSHLRPQGVVNAHNNMLMAKDAVIAKRTPILASEFAQDLYLVLDGNSTTANAIFSGWHQLPCVFQRQGGKTGPT